MIYSTGTINVSGNNAFGAGTNWTAPGSQVRAGQTLIALSTPPQMFQIVSVDNSTQLTVIPSASPTLNGQKYAILVSDAISVDGVAQAMSQLINEYDENIGAWETFALTSVAQNITVTINGQSVSIPSIGLIADRINGIVPVSRGGTGSQNAAGARSNLGLGTAAVANIGLNQGDVMTMGGSNYWNAIRISSVFDYNTVSAILGTYQQTPFFPGTGQGTIINATLESNDAYGSRWIGDTSGTPYFQGKINGTLTDAFKICAIGKTVTVDVNGFVKQASPIVRLFNDGTSSANEEAEGVTSSRVSVGLYEVKGSLGLNSDGVWTIEIPQDQNGNRLCFVDVKTAKDGIIKVSVFKRKFDIDTAMVVAGDPMDIPADRGLDLRLEMPEDSVYNRKMKAAAEAMKASGKESADEATGE